MDFMEIWEYAEGVGDVKCKPRVRALCAEAHKLYRKHLGYVDQGDVKATIMKLTAEQTPKWHQNQIRFLIESAISACHGNYNLDKSTKKKEFFTEFYNKFLCELLDSSKNYRTYNPNLFTPKKRKLEDSSNRSSRKKKKLSSGRRKKEEEFGKPTIRGLKCKARNNLAGFLRPAKGKLTCRFCGRRSVGLFKCLECQQCFCLKSPADLVIPGTDNKTFRKNGPFCWYLLHGFSSWKDL